MKKFRDGFMMKSPLPAHGKEFKDKAMKLSKESSGRDDAPDYDNPKVVELLEKAKKAEKEHGAPTKMSPLNERYYSADSFYGGDIDIPDLSGAGKVAGEAIDKIGKKGKKKQK